MITCECDWVEKTDEKEMYAYFMEYWRPQNSNLIYIMHANMNIGERVVVVTRGDDLHCIDCYKRTKINKLKFKHPEIVSLTLSTFFLEQYNYKFKEIVNDILRFYHAIPW